jgi:hypothetical protein
MIRDTFQATINEYKQSFKNRVQQLDRELIDGSPVDTGRFKSSWVLRWFDPDKFSYSRFNNIEYGMYLWRYKRSKQGWSPIGGDVMVQKHINNLRSDFNRINNKIFSV